MQDNLQATDQIRVKSARERVQHLQDQQTLEGSQTYLATTIGDYQIGKTLGKGTFGKVKEGIHLVTKQKVAIKIIDKHSIQDQDDKARINRQVDILRRARHPNIIHLYEIIQTSDIIYIIMEFAEKGQLFQLMNNEARLKERTAGRIFIQIMNAVQYLHRLGISHRDLKPQNILLDVDYNIKLIDFGLSNYKQQGKLLRTACGSPCYAPPQMVAGNAYDGQAGDLWSMGIIFYAMICGSLPFQEKTTKELYQKVIQGFYVIPSDISMNAIQVVQKMLITDPTKRITIPSLRKLQFFQNLKTLEPQLVGIIVGYHPMPIDNDIIEKMSPLFPLNKQQVQDDLKQNRHNKLTATYYLLQKKALRQGGRTIVDLQVFLQTHQKYKKQYGIQSLDKNNHYNANKSVRSHYRIAKEGMSPYDRKKYRISQHKSNEKRTPTKLTFNLNSERGNTANFSNEKLRKRFHTTTSEDRPTQRLSQRKNHQNYTQALKTTREENPSPITRPKQRSLLKTKSTKKALKPIKPDTNKTHMAQELWNAYFERSLQGTWSKEKKGKKITSVNPKQQQKIQAFHNNIRKLKQGFLKLQKN